MPATGRETDLIKIVVRQDGYYVIDRIFKGEKGVVSTQSMTCQASSAW